MRAKEARTYWDFDIINPLLAEICRKNRIKLLITGNLIQSKGNTPELSWMGNRPAMMEQLKNARIDLPSGGSVAAWFLEMALNTRIINNKVAEQIAIYASEIDKYTYYYQIEQISIDPDTSESFIRIEKRCWDDICRYGFTEVEFAEYRKNRRKEAVPEELDHLICDDSCSEPLCERLSEGAGFRPQRDKGVFFGFRFDSKYFDTGRDSLRRIIESDTRKDSRAMIKCTIPYIGSSDVLNSSFAGIRFALTSISGKQKTTLTEFIKRSGGTVTLDYKPDATVFIAKNIGDAQFFKENSAVTNYLPFVAKNALLNGIARKILGEKVSIILEEDLGNNCKKAEETLETSDQEQMFNEKGELLLTMAQAEAIWTVKAGKKGYTVSGYKGREKILYVPAFIDGTPVDTVGKGKKNKYVKKIVIPGTVQKINGGAFPDYAQLEELVFENAGTNVSAGAFTGCPLMYDENRCFVANGVLQDCLQQGDIVIPGNVRIIPESFLKKSSIKNITSITMQEGVETIGRCAFYPESLLAKNVKSIVLADTVKYIGYSAFWGISSNGPLESIVIGKSLQKMEYCIFACPTFVDVYYHGSQEDWYAIDKTHDGYPWDRELKSYTVHCNDGDIVYR